MSKTATKDVEVPELDSIEEVNPLDLIAALERDNRIQQAALRKIKGIRPSQYAGGPSNQNFGRRHEQALNECKTIAAEALSRLETEKDNDES